jgi:hypothetical protein
MGARRHKYSEREAFGFRGEEVAVTVIVALSGAGHELLTGTLIAVARRYRGNGDWNGTCVDLVIDQGRRGVRTVALSRVVDIMRTAITQPSRSPSDRTADVSDL